jgi:hypothetical protein
MPINNDDPGIREFECDECGMKTQEEGYMHYVEDYESETRARQILCPDCWDGFVKDGTIVLTPDCPCSGCN